MGSKNLSPEEKAIELVDWFVGFKLNPYNDPEFTVTLGRAKDGAHKVIDEIVAALTSYGAHTDELQNMDRVLAYYDKVKEEIDQIGK